MTVKSEGVSPVTLSLKVIEIEKFGLLATVGGFACSETVGFTASIAIERPKLREPVVPGEGSARSAGASSVVVIVPPLSLRALVLV